MRVLVGFVLDGHLRFDMIRTRRVDVCDIELGLGLRVFFEFAQEDREKPRLLPVCQHHSIALVFVKGFYQRPYVRGVVPPCAVAQIYVKFPVPEKSIGGIAEDSQPALDVPILLHKLLRALGIGRSFFKARLASPFVSSTTVLSGCTTNSNPQPIV